MASMVAIEVTALTAEPAGPVHLICPGGPEYEPLWEWFAHRARGRARLDRRCRGGGGIRYGIASRAERTGWDRQDVSARGGDALCSRRWHGNVGRARHRPRERVSLRSGAPAA